MRKTLAAFVLLVLAGSASAWNEKGHYVVCRLAWLQMTDQQRETVTAILKKHPHYEEYLIKNKPEGFSTDEWAFMRAGAWADWVRSGSARSYGHSTWHYINCPVCFPGMGESEDKHQPPAGQENAVWAMNRCLEKIKNGTDEEKAVYLTWLCHLVGDIHQPLHCVALFSDKFPDGDRGGNAIPIRFSSSRTNLHSFWDGLLGRGTTAGNIGKDVAEIQAVLKDKSEAIKPDMDAHTTLETWATEGAELARHAVYQDGELLKGHYDGVGVLQAPAGYAPACGRVARVQIGKAGIRLATTLHEVLSIQDVSMAEIETAWLSRGAKLNGIPLKLEWTQRETHKGLPKEFGPEDRESRKTMIVHGKKLRFESSEPLNSKSRKRTIAWQGSIAKVFDDNGGLAPNNGAIWDTEKRFLDFPMRAVCLGIRPSNPGFSEVDLREYRLRPEMSTVNGVSCCVLEKKVDGPTDSELYLNPSNGFLIQRIVGKNGRMTARQVDYKYALVDKIGWMPIAWQIVIMKNGTNEPSFCMAASEVKTTALDKADESVFDIIFPPGTLIRVSNGENIDRFTVDKDGLLVPYRKSPR